MYLTKIEMPLVERAVRAALSDCQKMHRLVMGLFDTNRQEAGVLYRARTQNARVTLYIYSAVPVREACVLPWMDLVGQRDVSTWLKQMQTGQVRRFDLLAMPAKKVAAEGRKNSQRRILRTMEERVAWLERKGAQYGFRLLSVQEQEGIRLAGHHAEGSGGSMTWDAYHYNGVLVITEAEIFRRAVSDGIGPGKAYGLGMLLLF